jgi:NADH dehydrogenase FAD-containing subunit
MQKHLVLVGGGHAHMATLAGLGSLVSSGFRVTVVQPSRHHYYSGMGPGMLGGFYRPEEIRFDTRQTVERGGGTFVQDRAKRIEPASRKIRLASGASLNYDVVSLNVGSEVSGRIAEPGLKDVFLVKPIDRLVEARNRFAALAARRIIDVAVVGGGPSAAEISGNLMGLARRTGLQPPKIRIYCKGRFFEGRPEKLARRVRQSLQRRGADIHEGSAVRQVETGRVEPEGAPPAAADLIFIATGVTPPKLMADSNLPIGNNGGLAVNNHLQCDQWPEIFGGGDCIDFQDRPLEKVGVYAVRQNPILFHNLRAALVGADLQTFDPGGGYLLIYNMGDGTGVFHKGPVSFSGQLAFRIKDAIDRRFMRRFQQGSGL